MNTNLNSAIPLTQPYCGEPWDYSGGETTTSTFITTNNIADWILIELRTGNSPGEATTIVGRRAALIRNYGVILDTDGSNDITFENVASGNYYITVLHRNHLAVMSSSVVSLTP